MAKHTGSEGEKTRCVWMAVLIEEANQMHVTDTEMKNKNTNRRREIKPAT